MDLSVRSETAVEAMSIFAKMTQMPDDPILGLADAFKKDPNPSKVNLGVGSYKDSEGRSYVLESVREADRRLLEQQLPKDYGPIEGSAVFREETVKLIFGEENPRNGSVCCLQTIGSTGALRIGASLLAEGDRGKAYVSDPTWPNHRSIFEGVGFQVESYPYYDSNEQTLLFDAMCKRLQEMAAGSIAIFQGPCHNPTGTDLSLDQWKAVSQIVKEKGLIPFFDVAYVGFGDGLEEDTAAVRQFAADGHEMFVSFSYSKNMGLYGERIGALAIVTDSAERAAVVMSNAKQVVRAQYSMPPLYPARLVAAILTDAKLKKDWIAELGNMRSRILGMRTEFAATLMTELDGVDLRFVEKQKGMFSFCGLDSDKAMRLREEFGIYLPKNGRVNIAGLTTKNIDYVTRSIATVLKG